MLDRVTREAGGGRLPDWLSTHPSPGNRAARIGSAIAPGSAADRTVNRADYLRRLDGMVYGENPREGFFQANAFFHPELRFTLAFPRGFTTRNQKQAVVGVSQAQDALVALTLAAEASVEEAARRFLSQQGLSAGRSGPRLDRRPSCVLARSSTPPPSEGSLRGQVAFVAKDGRVYRILGYTPAARFASYQGVFDAAIRSFRALDDPRYLGVQPKRIDIVGLQQTYAARRVRAALPLDREARDDRPHQRPRAGREPWREAISRNASSGAGCRVPEAQRRPEPKVSHAAGSPADSPCLSQRTRISEEPWVHDSGAT